MDIDWIMIEALGTILASSLALIFGLRDVFERYFNRPKIVLEHLNERSYVTNEWDVLTLNLRVKNEGSTTGKDIRVRIESVTRNGSELASSIEIGMGLLFEIKSLQSQDFDFHRFITVYHSGVGEDEINIAGMGSRMKREGYLTYRVKLLVTGENFKAYRRSFELIDSPNPNLIKLISV